MRNYGVDRDREALATMDDWSDRLVNDPRFLARIATARESARAGLGVKLEELDRQLLFSAPSRRRPGPIADMGPGLRRGGSKSATVCRKKS